MKTMTADQKNQPAPPRQQSAEIPRQAFGPVRIRAVAAATCMKAKPARTPEPAQRDLPPLLRRDQFFD